MRIFDNKLGLGAAMLAVVALGLTAAATLGGFSATVTNSTSNFSTATVQLEVSHGATTCYSTGTGAGGTVTTANKNTTCAINDFGGPVSQKPGGTITTTVVKLTNVGNLNASGGTLVTTACAKTNAAGTTYHGTASAAVFCGKIYVTVQLSTTASKCLYPAATAACGAPSSAGTLNGLGGHTFVLPALAAGASVTVTIKVQLAATATNADQGLKATVPMSWSIHQ